MVALYGAAGPDVELAVPDLPAHGARRDEPFTWERALEVVGRAVDRGTPGLPVVLVGHSLGGYLAMAYAADAPATGSPGLALLGASAVPAGPGAALYRAIASVEQRLGVDRMSRALDRQFDALLPEELAAVIKEAGYGFDGIPAAWAGVMGLCRPEMLAEVTCPGAAPQRPARPAAGRRAALRPGRPVGALGEGGHGAARAARVPADPPARHRGRAVGAAQRGPSARGAGPRGATLTAPPTGGTCATASVWRPSASANRSPGSVVQPSRPLGQPEGWSVP